MVKNFRQEKLNLEFSAQPCIESKIKERLAVPPWTFSCISNMLPHTSYDHHKHLKDKNGLQAKCLSKPLSLQLHKTRFLSKCGYKNSCFLFEVFKRVHQGFGEPTGYPLA